MRNLGNLSGVIYTSNPAQWDDVYVCHYCRKKRYIRKHGIATQLEKDREMVKDYEEIKNA
jgi:hypothetical protein